MIAIISMLRGVNVGGHNMVRMDALRALYVSLGLKDPQTYIQSGNVVFKAKGRNVAALSKKIGDGIERKFGFRPGVVVRSAADLRTVIARNPFAGRRDVEPGKLLVLFLADDPDQEARDKVRAMKTNPEELRIDGREVYIHFPAGQGKSKLPMALIERSLKTPGTGRNWNTVRKLLEMAEGLEG